MQDRSSGFQWPAQWTPDILATLMFVVQDGKILLIRKKRGIGAGKVNGPGGKFEPGGNGPPVCAAGGPGGTLH